MTIFALIGFVVVLLFVWMYIEGFLKKLEEKEELKKSENLRKKRIEKLKKEIEKLEEVEK